MNELTWLFAALSVGIAVGWLARNAAQPKAKKTAGDHPSTQPSSSLLLSVNHDLRQPLQALGLFIAALKNRDLPEELSKLATRIDASYASFTDEFSALIDLARLEDGRLKVTLADFATQDLWRRLTEDCQPQTEAHGQLLRFHQGKTTVLPGDLVLLQKILRPLVNAALSASEDGGMVLVALRHRQGKQRFEIWYGAPGFTQNQLSGLLAASAHGLTTEQKPSLAIRLAQQLCPLIGAVIGCRQREGQGGVLWLELS